MTTSRTASCRLLQEAQCAKTLSSSIGSTTLAPDSLEGIREDHQGLAAYLPRKIRDDLFETCLAWPALQELRSPDAESYLPNDSRGKITLIPDPHSFALVLLKAHLVVIA
jgi:hypothetical protein